MYCNFFFSLTDLDYGFYSANTHHIEHILYSESSPLLTTVPYAEEEQHMTEDSWMKGLNREVAM